MQSGLHLTPWLIDHQNNRICIKKKKPNIIFLGSFKINHSPANSKIWKLPVPIRDDYYIDTTTTTCPIPPLQQNLRQDLMRIGSIPILDEERINQEDLEFDDSSSWLQSFKNSKLHPASSGPSSNMVTPSQSISSSSKTLNDDVLLDPIILRDTQTDLYKRIFGMMGIIVIRLLLLVRRNSNIRVDGCYSTVMTVVGLKNQVSMVNNLPNILYNKIFYTWKGSHQKKDCSITAKNNAIVKSTDDDDDDDCEEVVVANNNNNPYTEIDRIFNEGLAILQQFMDDISDLLITKPSPMTTKEARDEDDDLEDDQGNEVAAIIAIQTELSTLDDYAVFILCSSQVSPSIKRSSNKNYLHHQFQWQRWRQQLPSITSSSKRSDSAIAA